MEDPAMFVYGGVKQLPTVVSSWDKGYSRETLSTLSHCGQGEGMIWRSGQCFPPNHTG
jgi:hypothetical protein